MSNDSFAVIFCPGETSSANTVIACGSKSTAASIIVHIDLKKPAFAVLIDPSPIKILAGNYLTNVNGDACVVHGIEELDKLSIDILALSELVGDVADDLEAVIIELRAEFDCDDLLLISSDGGALISYGVALIEVNSDLRSAELSVGIILSQNVVSNLLFTGDIDLNIFNCESGGSAAALGSGKIIVPAATT